MYENLRVLSIFARIPVAFIAACIWGTLFGINIWVVGNSLIALGLSFSFIFGKVRPPTS